MGGVVIADIAGIADPSVIPDPIGIPDPIVDIPGIAFDMDIASGMSIAGITSSLFTAGAGDEDTALLPSNSSMNCKYAWSLCRLSSTFFRSCR